MENAYCESFNGRLSEEFLNTTQFRHLSDARSRAGTWHKHSNQDRPHSSLNYRTPSEFAAQTLAYEAKQLYDFAGTENGRRSGSQEMLSYTAPAPTD